jgi:asparagine synthase (glutamine-hydrolysing)
MRSGVGERWREQTDRGLIASTAQHDVRAVYTGSEWANQFRVGDPSFTGIPVRFRYPLVDLRLIAFARSLPPDPWLIDKRVLREAARARLPAEVLLRKKTPLIVRPATGLDETRAHQLAELVSRCEGLKRFIDPAVLSQELLAGAGDALGQIRRPRERALGLAHWLWHR